MGISISIVGVSYLTASMYEVAVRANWDSLSADMPDMDMNQAMSRVTSVVSGLGDSCAGLFVILSSGITTAAYNLGGMNWLVMHLVEMEKYFVCGSGFIIGGVSMKLGMDLPCGNIMFLPMGLTGGATLFFGAVQAVPFFSEKISRSYVYIAPRTDGGGCHTRGCLR